MARPTRDIAVAVLLTGLGLVALFSSLGPQEAGFPSRVLMRIFKPALSAASSMKQSVEDAWRHYVELTEVSLENEKLKKEVSELKNRIHGIMIKERENERLRKLLDLKSGYQFQAIASRVIGEDVLGYYQSIFIDRGLEDGVKKDMPLASYDGLVGRITKSSGSMSQALLIIDPASSVDCRVARTRDRGALTGSMEGACILRFIDKDSNIKAGDIIVTSGLDGIFPKGLLVGRVQRIRKASTGLFLEANVTPSVDFSKLEEVLIIREIRSGFDYGTDLEPSK